MTDTVTQDAREYGLHIKQGGWRLGLLVARNVRKGTGGPTVARETVTARQFAELAGTSAKRVLRHLNAWQAAAADGHVPDAETLKPGDEVKLDADKLPDWSEYYPPMDGGYNGGTDRQPTVKQAKAVLAQLPIKERTAVVSEAVAGMDETDRLEVADAALEPSRQADTRARKDRRAVREEQHDEPSLAHMRLIALDLATANERIARAVNTAQDAGFTDTEEEWLVARVNVTASYLDALRLAISGAEDVDWDAELDRLNKEAGELTEGV